jgi:outer membrane immunogenic protein
MKSSTRITLAAAVVAALPLAAQAADMRMPVKAPPATSPWDGFYAGINAGGSLSRNLVHSNGRFDAPTVPITATPFDEAFFQSPAGLLAGAQIGYNFRVSPAFVVGVEADWQFIRQVGSTCTADCGHFNTAFFNLGGPGQDMRLLSQQRLQWLATARVRAGYATNTWLWYLTGGAAWGRVQDSYTFEAPSAIAPVPVPVPPGRVDADFSATRLGWTLGAGVETQLWFGFTAKLEYLFVDLGNISNFFSNTVPLFGVPTLPSSISITNHYHFTNHVFRAGLNYRFGDVPSIPLPF